MISKENGEVIKVIEHKKDGSKRKKPYNIFQYSYKLKSNKDVKAIYGQAANKPFDTISKKQKSEIGESICLR